VRRDVFWGDPSASLSSSTGEESEPGTGWFSAPQLVQIRKSRKKDAIEPGNQNTVRPGRKSPTNENYLLMNQGKRNQRGSHENYQSMENQRSNSFSTGHDENLNTKRDHKAYSRRFVEKRRGFPKKEKGSTTEGGLRHDGINICGQWGEILFRVNERGENILSFSSTGGWR